MKIEDTALAYIKKVIEVAGLVNICNLSIESHRIRGMDENSQVFILHAEGVPEFSFGAIGINRIPEFVGRLNMSRSATNFHIDATVEENGGSPFARSLQMKGKNLKAEYRCANPMTIMAPKVIKSPFFYEFDLSNDAASFVQQGQAAYKCTNVSLVGSDDGITLEMVDVNNDKMEYKIAEVCELDDSLVGAPAEISFKYTYPVKVLLPLLKNLDTQTVSVNGVGILRARVQGFDMHVFAVQ